MNRYLRLGLLATIACFAVALPAQADNLLTNGDFETGDFTGWTSDGGNFVEGEVYAHSGLHGVAYGTFGHTSPLYQDIATTPGDWYTFTFWQKTLDGFTNEFDASWGGVQLLLLVDSPITSVWTEYTFLVQASGASTRVESTSVKTRVIPPWTT